jgi:iron(III) transport system permease protein
VLTLRPRAKQVLAPVGGMPAAGAAPWRWGRVGGRRGARPPLVVWLPAVLALAGLAVPLVYLVYRTSQAEAGAWDLVFRARTAELLRNTALLALAVAAGTTAVAVPLAWLTTRTDLPLKKGWAVAAALPLVVPSYVGALAVVSALGPKGLVQGWLEPVGVERLPSIYGFWGAALTLIAFTYPYVYLSVRAGLRGLDPALEEATRCLGHGPWRTFFGTTLPQLRPAIGAGALLAALYAVSDFGVVTLLRYDAFTRAIYVQYKSSFDRTQAAALALVLVAFAALLLAGESWLRGRGRAVYHRLGAGAARRARPVALGRWRWPALLYCGAVVGLGIGLTVGVLLYWLVNGLSRHEEAASLRSDALHSIAVGGWGAAATTLAALPVAILAVRYGGRLGSLVERASYLGYALPGIVIALSFVFIGARYLPALYQTLPLLVVAYVVRFLPQAVGAARTSLLQVSPRLEEAARNLGRSPLGAATSVTLPLARPGILTGAALVFLTVMKELPLTLLLRPTGYDTLATSVWTATGSGSYARAAAPALLLIAISAIPTLLLLARDGETRRGED